MFLAVAFALVSLALAMRLSAIGRRLRELTNSAYKRETLLIEKQAHDSIGRDVEVLHGVINALISESRTDRDRDRDYLRQIETTLGSIREAVLIVDENSFVCMANEAARTLVGPDKQIVGRRVESLLPGVAFLDYMYGVREGRKTGAESVEIVKGEEHFWFEVTGAVISDVKARQKMCLYVLHDITRLKALENIRKEFVANVSHELRTPVTIIRGFTDTLIDEGEQLTPEERSRFLGKIQRNVVRLNSLLEDLLTISRLEGNSAVLKLENLSLNDLALETCNNFKERLDQGRTIEFIPAAEMPLLPIDPLRITQVLENLLENANKHARGMTKLVVRTELKEKTVTCRVEDNGCGIPTQDLPHIFERFYRVDKGRSREQGGTGLGLSIVKHIVIQHGGTVFVESVQGKGTTIGFELPIAVLPTQLQSRHSV